MTWSVDDKGEAGGWGRCPFLHLQGSPSGPSYTANSGRGLGGHPLRGAQKAGEGSSSNPPRIQAHLDLGEAAGSWNLGMWHRDAGSSGVKARGSGLGQTWIRVLALPWIAKGFH